MPTFITKNWIEVHDQPGNAENRYKPSKQLRFKTSMLQSDLCDYSDAYNVAEWTISVKDPNDNEYDKKLALKNKAPFISCITNYTLIDNAEDLDNVMPMYNLIEYSKNYSKTSGSLWNYYMDESNDGAKGNINYSIKDSKSFDYKTSITGKLECNNETKDVKIVVPLKHSNKFWRTLVTPLITCEINLILI